MSFSFLKENGELLSIAAKHGMLLDNGALHFYEEFYGKSDKIAQFFPQYCRFILSIILDLESLGLGGAQGQKIANFARDNQILEFDTCDTRRLEALLLLRQGLERPSLFEKAYQQVLNGLTPFLNKPDQFLKFNTPLFYEFTHIVFFLTDYGRQQSPVDVDLVSCTMNGGRLAYLDQDADLLAEFCVCLNYLKAPVPRPWIAMLEQALNDIEIIYDQNVASALNPSVDDYHPYLVINWALSFERSDCFSHRFQSGTPRFKMQYPETTILSRWSERLFKMEVEGKADTSGDDWCADMLNEQQTGWLNSGLEADPGMAKTIHGFSNGLITL